jgi:hypothetical protein
MKKNAKCATVRVKICFSKSRKLQKGEKTDLKKKNLPPHVFWDPGSEIRDPGWEKIRIRDKHPGYATLVKRFIDLIFQKRLTLHCFIATIFAQHLMLHRHYSLNENHLLTLRHCYFLRRFIA